MSDLIGEFLEFAGRQGHKLEVSIRYSGRFKPYNASVRKSGSRIVFSLGREWSHVSPEITLGLLQSLSSRLLKTPSNTVAIDLYNNFIRNLHVGLPKTQTDPYLQSCFDRVNEKYFQGLVEKPNFGWHRSLSRLATYNYHTDTISVSSIFRGNDDIIDYLIYHEILHKQLKFSHNGNKSIHHSHRFREMEKSYENSEHLEKEISRIVRKSRRGIEG